MLEIVFTNEKYKFLMCENTMDHRKTMMISHLKLAHKLTDDDFTLGARCDKMKGRISVLDRQRRDLFVRKDLNN